MKAAVFGARAAFAGTGRRVPIQAQVTLDASGRMLLGTDIAAALAILEALRVDVIGLNCSTGPEHMREPIRYLTEHTSAARLVHPQRGAALNIGGDAVLSDGARAHGRPAGRVRPRVRRQRRRRVLRHHSRAHRPIGRVASASTAPARPASRTSRRGSRSAASAPSTLHQEPPPLLIGERVNSQGSRRSSELLLADDYDGIVRVAREPGRGRRPHSSTSVSRSPSATTRRSRWRAAVKASAAGVDAPLVIDSHRRGRHRRRAGDLPGARDRQLRSTWRTAASRCDAVLPLVRDARRSRHRAHDRRAGDGQDARAEARDRPADPRHRTRRVRSRPATSSSSMR